MCAPNASPAKQDDGRAEQAADQIGGQAAEDDRGAPDRRRPAACRSSRCRSPSPARARRSRWRPRTSATPASGRRRSPGRCRKGVVSGKVFETWPMLTARKNSGMNSVGDRRLGIARRSPARPPAQQQDLGHAATSWPRLFLFFLGALEPAPGRLQEHVVQRRARDRDRPDPDRRARPGGARSRRSSRRRPRRRARARPARRPPAPARAARRSPPRCAAASAPSELDRDHVVADLRLQALGRPLGDDLAGVDDRHPVAELVGLLQVLRRQEDGRARWR